MLLLFYHKYIYIIFSYKKIPILHFTHCITNTSYLSFTTENPSAEEDDYRVEVLIALRKLERLDKEEYTEDERNDAEEMAEARKAEEANAEVNIYHNRDLALGSKTLRDKSDIIVSFISIKALKRESIVCFLVKI